MNKQRRPQLLFPFLVTAFVIIFAIWAFFALNTGNLLWFRSSPERSYTPDRIVIHYYGTTTEVQPGSDDFRDLNAALNQVLGSFRGRVPVGLSAVTVDDYREKEFVVELFFSSDIGSVIGLGSTINHLIIPIDGRHSGSRFVFVGDDDNWLASALIMENPQPLFTTLNELGFPVK